MLKKAKTTRIKHLPLVNEDSSSFFQQSQLADKERRIDKPLDEIKDFNKFKIISVKQAKSTKDEGSLLNTTTENNNTYFHSSAKTKEENDDVRKAKLRKSSNRNHNHRKHPVTKLLTNSNSYRFPYMFSRLSFQNESSFKK